MALDIVVKSLMQVELFAGLRPLEIAELARRSDRIVYKPGDVIIAEGAVGDAAVLVVSGDAVRTTGPGLEAPQPIPAGSLLGELAMLIETAHSSTVVARSMTRAIRITRAAVHQQIASDPRLADHLSHKLARRLQAIAQDLREIDSTLASLESPPVPFHAAGAPAVAAPAAALH